MRPRSSASAQPPSAASCSIKAAESSTARAAARRDTSSIFRGKLLVGLAPCPGAGVAFATMNIRTILVALGVLALGGYAFYDYYSPESKLAREMKEIEQLEPDVKVPECFPKGTNSKLFMVGITRDLRPRSELENDATRRSAIKHDCIRGNGPKTLPRVVKALGEQGVPIYAEVMQKCPVVKDEYPVYSCFALDALAIEGSKASVAVLEKELTDREKGRKNVYLGALFRLLNTPGWRTNAQIAGMLATETEWEGKE